MSGTRGQLFVVSAPSGAGKSTLVGRVLARVEGLAFSVSWTTRPPRRGERHGVEYRFTDDQGFSERIAAGRLLEWAEVHGHRYGTGRDETEAVLAAGRDLLLDIDVQGAEQVRGSGVEAVTVFILPPDAPTLRTRLLGRGTDDAETVERRLANAAAEVRRWREFDHVVVNDDLDRAAEELIAIVLAARCRRDRRAARARAIAATFAES
jgi:guanylate kinase